MRHSAKAAARLEKEQRAAARSAGRLLAERAEEIIGRLDAAENELAAHIGLRGGRIRLAAFPSALGTIVPAAAARLGLPQQRAGMLRTRRRLADVAVFAALGVGLLVAGLIFPAPT